MIHLICSFSSKCYFCTDFNSTNFSLVLIFVYFVTPDFYISIKHLKWLCKYYTVVSRGFGIKEYLVIHVFWDIFSYFSIKMYVMDTR